jgi:isopropylmalate/homocitrate/citramalate synthase
MMRRTRNEPLNAKYSTSPQDLGRFEANFPKSLKIVEVGPRDGLQNEKQIIATKDKIDMVHKLVDSGIKVIEVGAFVSPKWVPQMADSADVIRGLRQVEGVSYPVLTPNMQGFNAALKAGAKEVAVFVAASEAFSQKNINVSIDESFARYKDVCQAAIENGIKLRGYVSCVMGCPYQGYVAPHKVAEVAEKLLNMGCYEISLGDTVGTGTPGATYRMLSAVLNRIPLEKTAVHFHDTYGQALANILTALQMGVSAVDSSVGGLGGCPYAAGATGNVATEEVLYMAKDLGIHTGVDIEKVVDVGLWIGEVLGGKQPSRAAAAINARRKREAKEKSDTTATSSTTASTTSPSKAQQRCSVEEPVCIGVPYPDLSSSSATSSSNTRVSL